MKLLQMIIPVPVDSAPMTEGECNTLTGIFILMNIVYFVSLIICTVVYFKLFMAHKERAYRYKFSINYFNYVFLNGANIGFCEIVNMLMGVVDVIAIIWYLGSLIGKML